MSPPVTVLYEDQRGPRRGFGLHELVWRCVYDEVDHDEWACKRVFDPRPMKGVSKLLRACGEEAVDIARDGREIVAVVDADAIRRELQLAPAATADEIVARVRRDSSARDRLHVVLLVENAESVIAAAAACDPTIDGSVVKTALRKARGALDARDSVLTTAAWGAPTVRTCIRARVPSFEALVQLLVRFARDALGIVERDSPGI